MKVMRVSKAKLIADLKKKELKYEIFKFSEFVYFLWQSFSGREKL